MSHNIKVTNNKLHGHERGEPFHLGGVSAVGKVTVFLLEVGFSLPSAQHSAQSALCVLHILFTCYRKPGLAGPLLWWKCPENFLAMASALIDKQIHHLCTCRFSFFKKSIEKVVLKTERCVLDLFVSSHKRFPGIFKRLELRYSFFNSFLII